MRGTRSALRKERHEVGQVKEEVGQVRHEEGQFTSRGRWHGFRDTPPLPESQAERENAVP